MLEDAPPTGHNCARTLQNRRAREAEPGTTAPKYRSVVVGGRRRRKAQRSKETSVLPLRQVAKLRSWRSVRSMELDESLLLQVTQTRGSSARQNGTLEISQAFPGNLKSGLEAGVQQKRQQTAHFHVLRGCLGHPSPLRDG